MFSGWFRRLGNLGNLNSAWKANGTTYRNFNKKANWTLGGPLTSKIPQRIKYTRNSATKMLAFLAGIMAVGYASSTPVEVPYLNRYRRKLPGSIEEIIGNFATQMFIQSVENDIVDFEHPLVKNIQAIGDHICKSNNIPLHRFVLIDSPEINAFVLPGKTVFVFTGILPILATQSGAAMVFGHEIGHILAGHVMDKLIFIVPFAWFANKIIGTPGTWLAELMSAHRSRANESEADTIGLHILARSCMDITESTAVFERMRDTTGESNTLWDSHPSWENRIYNLTEHLKTSEISDVCTRCTADIKYKSRNNRNHTKIQQFRWDTDKQLPRMTVQQRNEFLSLLNTSNVVTKLLFGEIAIEKDPNHPV